MSEPADDPTDALTDDLLEAIIARVPDGTNEALSRVNKQFRRVVFGRMTRLCVRTVCARDARAIAGRFALCGACVRAKIVVRCVAAFEALLDEMSAAQKTSVSEVTVEAPPSALTTERLNMLARAFPRMDSLSARGRLGALLRAGNVRVRDLTWTLAFPENQVDRGLIDANVRSLRLTYGTDKPPFMGPDDVRKMLARVAAAFVNLQSLEILQTVPDNAHDIVTITSSPSFHLRELAPLQWLARLAISTPLRLVPPTCIAALPLLTRLRHLTLRIDTALSVSRAAFRVLPPASLPGLETIGFFDERDGAYGIDGLLTRSFPMSTMVDIARAAPRAVFAGTAPGAIIADGDVSESTLDNARMLHRRGMIGTHVHFEGAARVDLWAQALKQARLQLTGVTDLSIATHSLAPAAPDRAIHVLDLFSWALPHVARAYVSREWFVAAVWGARHAARDDDLAIALVSDVSEAEASSMDLSLALAAMLPPCRRRMGIFVPSALAARLAKLVQPNDMVRVVCSVAS
jgi:hypothetical protein